MDYSPRTVTVEGGKLVWAFSAPTVAQIVDIEVEHGYRRRGVGRKLVYTMYKQLASSGVRTVFAVTRASNLVAQLFYEELRYRALPLRDFYKDEPLENGKAYADAVMYVRDMGSQA